tara:strand:+ start:487 stop:747 length:261 start_codon:yes stop_codon:yes gene_type:complete
MYTWNITLNLGDLIMTPQENIYHSDEDVVDGLDIRDMMEDDQYEHAFYDDVDDGQPDLEQECDDLYGYGPEWDCYHDCIDYPEDWG